MKGLVAYELAPIPKVVQVAVEIFDQLRLFYEAHG
jgi:hypothetical protein